MVGASLQLRVIFLVLFYTKPPRFRTTRTSKWATRPTKAVRPKALSTWPMMPKEFGRQISSNPFRRHSLSTRLVAGEKSFSPMKARCTVSNAFFSNLCNSSTVDCVNIALPGNLNLPTNGCHLLR